MAGNSPEEIAKTKKAFLIVGAILGICTVSTVAVAVVPWMDVGAHGFSTGDVVLGLAIATFKASLVALIFMHFAHEKKCIKWIFIGSLFFAGSMIALIGLGVNSPTTFKGLLPQGSSLPVQQRDAAYHVETLDQALAADAAKATTAVATEETTEHSEH